MCGIVGYIGREQAAPILLDGLEKLEYRGYDSAGVCISDSGSLKVAKAKGRLSHLAQLLDGGRRSAERRGSAIRAGRRTARLRMRTAIRILPIPERLRWFITALLRIIRS